MCGPMWYTAAVGLSVIHNRICEFEERYGRRWRPVGLLRQPVERSESFSKLEEQSITAPEL